jgi:hypothetical protein
MDRQIISSKRRKPPLRLRWGLIVRCKPRLEDEVVFLESDLIIEQDREVSLTVAVDIGFDDGLRAERLEAELTGVVRKILGADELEGLVLRGPCIGIDRRQVDTIILREVQDYVSCLDRRPAVLRGLVEKGIASTSA